jgi:hypothetical protein
MAAPFGPRFALSAALSAALRGGLACGVGFRECLADRLDGASPKFLASLQAILGSYRRDEYHFRGQ